MDVGVHQPARSHIRLWNSRCARIRAYTQEGEEEGEEEGEGEEEEEAAVVRCARRFTPGLKRTSAARRSSDNSRDGHCHWQPGNEKL